jgi:PIN domain nuclease of toxin-antitoxin system
MTLLIDTHAIVWWLAADERLSRRAWRILESSANRRLVSIASLWEIAIKMSTGRLPTKGLTLQMIADHLSEQEFVVLPVRLEDLLRLESLPWIHRDPFDRVLVAQALAAGVPLLTADSVIAGYPVETIW